MSQKKIEEVSDDFWENQVDKENKMLIEYFLEQGHLSPKTLIQYRSALKIFAKWVHDNCIPLGRKKIYTLKPKDALNYQNWLVKKMELSPSGVKFKRSAVSSLCGYIELYYGEEEGYENFRNIYSKAIPNVPKSNKKEKLPLSVKELETLSSELEKREEWQKLAYLWFSYTTGCRREESRQLLAEVANYDLVVGKDGKDKKFYVTHSIRAKGRGTAGKVRKFKFNERAMVAIRKWVEYRKTQVAEDNCPYLFVSKSKGEYRQLSANTFNLWCDSFSTILGGRPVHPHLLRSSRATNAVVEEGLDIKKVQKMLGHNSTQTTEIYIVRDDEDDDDDLYD